MEGYQHGVGGRRMGQNIQGIRNIIGRFKIDKGVLRVV